MNHGRDAIHPELRWCIEDVARQVRQRVWYAELRRFGWWTFLLTGLATGILAIFRPEGTAGTVVLGVYGFAVAILALRGAVHAVRRPVTFEQIALYIDEHHPELENRISSALDLTVHERTGISEWMSEQFLLDALDRVRETSFADVLDPTPVRKLRGAALSMVASSAILLFLFSHLWATTVPSFRVATTERVVALPFTVEPGDARVRAGDSQMVWIRTDESDREVVVRFREGGGAWREVNAGQSNTPNVYFHQFADIQRDTQYEVQYGRQRSERYTITTWTPPEVSTIDLTYQYPDYLGRPPREVPNSGNMAAIEGTTVEMDVWINKPVEKADMVLESGERVPLKRRSDTRWTHSHLLERDDAYTIELVDEEGAENEYPREYTIAMHRDEAPEIVIDFPRGDNEVTMLDEVPFDFEVSDDYGFESFGVQYEIAGRDPVRVELNEHDDVQTAAAGHHTLLLEELGLDVGDFITWTVWAQDTKPDRTEYEILGDPYFLEIRPFKREYREAVSGGGMQGGGGAQGEPDQLQKDILIATWNLRRDSRYMDTEEFAEKRAVIVESQESLIQQLSQAGGMFRGADANVRKLREAMEGSVEALTRAELPDPKPALSDATVQQQNALRLMARLKPRDSEVTQQQGGGGGGGGAQQRPDISELEMARNRNFYEQENLTREQQQAADEVMNRIKELARRQQAINEQLAELISELQREQDEEERERLRRQLERLEEEMKSNLERLDESRQDLLENALSNEQTRQAQDALERARRQMNRSLEQMNRNELQQARTAGTRAMDALQDIEEHLRQFGGAAAAQRMRELQDRMQGLQDRQRAILEKTREAREKHESPSMDDQETLEQLQKSLQEEKDALSEQFVEMMEDAGELAARGKQSQELMTRRLGDWLRETSQEGIYESIDEAKPLIEYGIWDSAYREERKIGGKLDEAAEELQSVAEALVEDDLEGMQKALGQLDELMEREEVANALGDGEESDTTAAGGQADTSEDETGAGGESEQESERMAARGDDASEREQKAPGEAEGVEGARRSPEQNDAERMETAQGDRGRPGTESPESQQGEAHRRAGDPSGQGSPDRSAPRGDGSREGFDPQRAMREFAEDGYQEWIERLRDAEALLPQGTPIRTEVTRLREQIEGFRRDWRSRALEPQYDLFLEMAVQPLAETAEDLQREIERQLGQKEFQLADEGEVPERYREHVADYFKRLSEAEAAQ